MEWEGVYGPLPLCNEKQELGQDGKAHNAAMEKRQQWWVQERSASITGYNNLETAVPWLQLPSYLHSLSVADAAAAAADAAAADAVITAVPAAACRCCTSPSDGRNSWPRTRSRVLRWRQRCSQHPRCAHVCLGAWRSLR